MSSAAPSQPESFVGTSAPLESLSYFFGEYCKLDSEAFMRCKEGNANPAACAQQGTKVTQCALDLLQKIKGNCNQEYAQHWQCLDWNNHELTYCREEQKVFDGCMNDKLGLGKQRYEDLKAGKFPAHEKV